MALRSLHGVLVWAVRRLGPAFLWLHALTLRFRVDGEDRLQTLLAAGRPVILAGWHGRLLCCAVRMSRYRPLAMVSQSRDGDLMAALLAGLGYRPVRASTTRGGVRGLLELVRALEPGKTCAHAVDGPRGPAGHVQGGVVLLAQRAGAALVPTCASAASRVVTRSWDRMQIPLPFGTIHIRLHAALEVRPDLDEAGREALRGELEKRLAEGHAALP